MDSKNKVGGSPNRINKEKFVDLQTNRVNKKIQGHLISPYNFQSVNTFHSRTSCLTLGETFFLFLQQTELLFRWLKFREQVFLGYPLHH